MTVAEKQKSHYVIFSIQRVCEFFMSRLFPLSFHLKNDTHRHFFLQLIKLIFDELIYVVTFFSCIFK